MQIRKSDGTKQKFDEQKLARGLERAKVPKSLITETIKHIEKMSRPGTSTNAIHTNTLHFLEARDPASAARYNLKRAMLNIGPSGYPFENYIAKLMQAYGWKTQVGITIPGKCVTHEIDIYGEREGSKDRAVEAKYHSRVGIKTDVKTTLYVKARHDDLTTKNPNLKGVLITNTQFTADAIAYGECTGMKMKGWDYPKNEGLAKYIEDKQLYPITVFSKIQKHITSKLTNHGIVLASELCELKHHDAKQFGLSQLKLEEIQQEAKLLCNL